MAGGLPIRPGGEAVTVGAWLIEEDGEVLLEREVLEAVVEEEDGLGKLLVADFRGLNAVSSDDERRGWELVAYEGGFVSPCFRGEGRGERGELGREARD